VSVYRKNSRDNAFVGDCFKDQFVDQGLKGLCFSMLTFCMGKPYLGIQI